MESKSNERPAGRPRNKMKRSNFIRGDFFCAPLTSAFCSISMLSDSFARELSLFSGKFSRFVTVDSETFVLFFFLGFINVAEKKPTRHTSMLMANMDSYERFLCMKRPAIGPTLMAMLFVSP